MKQTITLSFLLFFALACGDDKKKEMAGENAADAASSFIRAALDGDYEKAKHYMLQDSVNLEDLNTAIRLHERLTPEERTKYRESSIRIFTNRALNDSANIITYSNSFRNRKDSLLVVRVGEQWMVDFKYIFQHKTDSLP
ncbi:MAG: DUF4878 domain-containing protein [Chitinophagaceae bacterium]|nr:DUF4878 domain-containing protein [Chitinophagaceae bacterium]